MVYPFSSPPQDVLFFSVIISMWIIIKDFIVMFFQMFGTASFLSSVVIQNINNVYNQIKT